MSTEDLEYAVDLSLVSFDADLRMATRGVPLADFEDEDGFLPHESGREADDVQALGR